MHSSLELENMLHTFIKFGECPLKFGLQSILLFLHRERQSQLGAHEVHLLHHHGCSFYTRGVHIIAVKLFYLFNAKK